MIEKLKRLSEIAPDMCREIDSPVYAWAIGDYEFTMQRDGLMAWCGSIAVTGRPALAWLRDALEQAIEARGWYLEVRYWTPRGRWRAEVANREVWGDTPAEALLDALLAAVEGEKGEGK